MDNSTTINSSEIWKDASIFSVEITILNAAFNMFLSISAILGNIVFLVALRKVSSIHAASKLLFQCLALTDLGVGLTTQPLFAALELRVATKLNTNALIFLTQAQRGSVFIFCGVSILTSTAISVDRLLSLVLRQRYRQVVTLRRVRALTICFWLTSVSAGLTDVVNVVAGVTMILCVFFSLFSYSTIFVKLRQHQPQVQNVVNQTEPTGGRIPLKITLYKATVNTIAWIQLALVICYVPFFVCLMIDHSRGPLIAYDLTVTLCLLNSSINPVLYYWKIKEVRQAVKESVRGFNCSSNLVRLGHLELMH